MTIEQIRPELTWRIRQRVMYPDKELEHVQLLNDFEGMHFGLFAENKLCSVISLFRDEEGWQFRKFATLTEHQGKGYGKALLQYLINFCREEKTRLEDAAYRQLPLELWCYARLSAASFYEQFGMKRDEVETFTREGMEYVRMEMEMEV